MATGRNLSAFAAVVAKEEEGENLNSCKLRNGSEKRKRVKEIDNENCENVCKKVALAIEKFGDLYKRVEAKKQRQMLELEKQRMRFIKDLEYQRLQLFMETQVQLHKINTSKHSSAPGEGLNTNQLTQHFEELLRNKPEFHEALEQRDNALRKERTRRRREGCHHVRRKNQMEGVKMDILLFQGRNGPNL
ncbi:unnamed protein product [Lupinus luteus]|uniref:Uncharacterized protein n=1 Tax=Lupinus luteus TaxID=3873 RepID=A0AAV1XPN1_LUPLU